MDAHEGISTGCLSKKLRRNTTQPKRDMDLIRELLLRLELCEMEIGDVFMIAPDDKGIAVNGCDSAQVEYHLSLLRDQSFINSPGSQPMLGITFAGLTWQGHDFLDSVRDPEIWEKIKKSASAVKGFTFDLHKDLAKGLIKKQLDDYNGVKLWYLISNDFKIKRRFEMGCKLPLEKRFSSGCASCIA